MEEFVGEGILPVGLVGWVLDFVDYGFDGWDGAVLR